MDELEGELRSQRTVNVELTAELKDGSTDDALRSKVADLESQLETLRQSEQLAWKQKKLLEDELKNLKTLEEVCTHKMFCKTYNDVLL